MKKLQKLTRDEIIIIILLVIILTVGIYFSN